jgi:uncharacterized protein YcbK (DUF882 family)
MRKFISTLVLLAFLLFPNTAADARGRAQKRQNAAADKHDLTRIKNRDQLRKFIDAGLLVLVDDTDAYVISDELGEKDPKHRRLYKHARQYTKDFLDDLLSEAHRKFGSRYVVTSLVRTVDYQRKLCRSNGNAICGSRGWKRSSHLTGAAVDISYVGMSKKERKWFRKELKRLQADGKIIYIREFSQACFHIMVLPNYT